MKYILHIVQKYLSQFKLKLDKPALTYLFGLLGYSGRATCAGMAGFLGISHDKVTRYLGIVSADDQVDKALAQIADTSQRGRKGGYLVVDATLLPKMFAKAIDYLAIGFSSILGKPIKGLTLVVILRKTGSIAMPLAFRFWVRKKEMKEGEKYKRKSDIARELLLLHGTRNDFVLMDGEFASAEMMDFLDDHDFYYIMRIPKNRCVKNEKDNAQLRDHRSLRIRKGQSCRITKAIFKGRPRFFIAHRYTHKQGKVTTKFLVSNRRKKASQYTKIYHHRWVIEKFFRTIKQHLGVEHAQVRSGPKQIAHIKICFLAYALLQIEKKDRRKSSVEEVLGAIRPQNCSSIPHEKLLLSATSWQPT